MDMLASLIAFVISMPLIAHVGPAWELVGAAWGATSTPVLLTGLAGAGALSCAILGRSRLHPLVRRSLMIGGTSALVSLAIYQVGAMKGAEEAFRADAAKALAAERQRREAAEAINTIIANRATSDLAAERAANAKLKELNDALARDPDRNRVCVDRGTARRLRDL